MSLGDLLVRVVVVWLFLSVVLVVVWIVAAELVGWRERRKLSNVTPLYPQSSHVRVVSGKDGAA